MLKILIEVEAKNRKWLQLKNIEKFLQKTCKKIIANTEIPSLLNKNANLLLAISLVSNLQIQKINHQFRGINKPTDILSFPALDEKIIRKSGLKSAIENPVFLFLGDLLIAFELVEKDAKAQNKLFHQHLTHLLTHGILHLIGFDHEEYQMAEEMETKEIEILQKFQIANPYKY